MKNIFLLLFLAVSVNLIAQRPCSWYTANPTDSAAIDSARKEVVIHKLRSNQEGPYIDGAIDALWDEFEIHKMDREVVNKTSNQTLSGNVRWCYDNKMLYLLVVVYGDDTIYSKPVATQSGDIVQVSYQATFGGKGTAADHYDEADWQNWYWMKDGDRKWAVPNNQDDNVVQWLNTDAQDDGTSTCEETWSADWIVLESKEIILLGVAETADSIVFEMAYNWQSWLRMDTVPDIGHEFGLSISYKDKDKDGGEKEAQLNFSDIGNNAYAYAPACAKFTMGDTLIAPVVTTGTFDITANSLNVFPVPATDNLTIDWQGNTISSIAVYDMMGRLQLNYNYNSNESMEHLNISTLEVGVYHIVVNDGQRTEQLKFVKQ